MFDSTGKVKLIYFNTPRIKWCLKILKIETLNTYG